MTTPAMSTVRLRQVTMSLVTLVGGVSLAAIPASTLAVSSRIFTAHEQGVVSVAIMAATFSGQLAFAAVVESRLSSAATERRVTFPLWLAAASVVAAVAVAANHLNPWVLSLALPVLLASLEVGRGVSVAERLDRREAWAALIVGIGALGGVVVAFAGLDWGLIPLVAGIAGATAIRSMPVAHLPSRPSPRITGWVVTDVAITGIIYPALNALILLVLGPVSAVLFAAISTVSGLLAIPLNFMRLRLLKSHSLLDIWVSAAALLLGTAVIFVLEATGLLGYIFGGSWSTSATIVPLGIACLWRASSLATTLPFAALRRAGEVKLLTILRGALAVATFGAGISVLPLQNISLVFGVMLAGELAQAVVYELARRRRIAVSTDAQVTEIR